MANPYRWLRSVPAIQRVRDFGCPRGLGPPDGPCDMKMQRIQYFRPGVFSKNAKSTALWLPTRLRVPLRFLRCETTKEYITFALTLWFLRCGNAKSTALSHWCVLRNAKSITFLPPTRPRALPHTPFGFCGVVQHFRIGCLPTRPSSLCDVQIQRVQHFRPGVFS